jgi:thioredoxin reductase (NADPH)
VDNFPGFSKGIQGPDLMKAMHDQVRLLGVNLIYDDIVDVQCDLRSLWTLTTSSQETFSSTAVIWATGAQSRHLNVPGEKEFWGHGVSSCATCDGFFFKEKIVAVVGGGNSALEEAIYLSGLAKQVYLIHRRDTFRGEHMLQTRVFNNTRIAILWNMRVHSIKGHAQGVTSIILENTSQFELFETLLVDGVFIAIGHEPNTRYIRHLSLAFDEQGYIDASGPKTPLAGFFVAGDVRDAVYRQAITAAGEGCKAALESIDYVRKLNS